MKFRNWTVMTRLGLGLFALVAGATAEAGYREGMEALSVRDYSKARAEFESDRSNPRSL